MLGNLLNRSLSGRRTVGRSRRHVKVSIAIALIAASAVLSPVPATASHQYIDVHTGHWAHEEIEWVTDHGYMVGFPTSLGQEFRPTIAITRAQSISALWKSQGMPQPYGPHGLTDVPGWIDDAVRWGVAHSPQIVAGYSDHTFRPNNTIKRREFVSWLYNLNGTPDVSAYPAHGLTDVDPWYDDAVTWAVYRGIATGYSDHTFRGALDITRAQTANWLMRAQPNTLYERERAGSTFWAPDWTRNIAAYYSSQENRLTWHFGWEDSFHRQNLGGSFRALELKAVTNELYADSYGSYESNNFPSGSDPYKDSAFSDFGSNRTFGYGAGHTGLGNGFFLPNVDYFASVSVYKPFLSSSAQGIAWDFRPSSRLENNIPCAVVAFCVFNDYTLAVERAREFQATQNATVDHYHDTSWAQSTDSLSGFEVGNANYWDKNSGTTGTVECASIIAPQGNCYATFENGGGSVVAGFVLGFGYGTGGYVFRATDNASAEVLVMCPRATNQTCPVQLSLIGQNVNSSGAVVTTETRATQTVSIPGAGTTAAEQNIDDWYLCRLDETTGASLAFTNDYQQERVQVTAAGGLIAVDDPQIRGYQDVTDDTAGDPTEIRSVPTCTKWEDYYDAS